MEKSTAGFLFYLGKLTRRICLRLSNIMFSFICSFCSTFFNPYGIGLWREVWSSVTDSSLRWSIAEWMPSFFMLDLSMISLVSLSFILITKYRKKFTKEELVLYYFSLIQGILSRRNL